LDWDNMPEVRKANSVRTASLLSQFVGSTAWAHLDIMGMARYLDRLYCGPRGYGISVRLLVDLAGGEYTQATCGSES
jgi:leucyl aminopeptidase